ncbi:transcription repressor OFP12-like [Chenopodium quinoa]|uniref:transcription repressor OFP12-like n=1 Tax=Chenopodium quinoa TaxID=63459 RepID=UPI000B775648|nr:transcription repressor OFP12-like [Chenopodium quinoa]
MPSIFRNHFHLCFSKIKCLPTSLSAPLTLDDDDDNDDKYFDHIPNNLITINNHPHPSSSILNNFNIVFDNPSTSSSSSAATTSIFLDNNLSSSFSNSSATATATDECPDLSAIFASQRLFVSTPGLSNSILESPSFDDHQKQEKLVGGGVPIKKDSPDPYSDFRRSMQEMIEARKIEMKRNNQHNLVALNSDGDEDANDESDDLSEYLKELLLCYLNLNPKHTHKFIIEAFADLLVSLMPPPPLPHRNDTG